MNVVDEDDEEVGSLVLKCERMDCELRFLSSAPKDFIPAAHGLCVDVDATETSHPARLLLRKRTGINSALESYAMSTLHSATPDEDIGKMFGLAFSMHAPCTPP